MNSNPKHQKYIKSLDLIITLRHKKYKISVTGTAASVLYVFGDAESKSYLAFALLGQDFELSALSLFKNMQKMENSCNIKKRKKLPTSLEITMPND